MTISAQVATTAPSMSKHSQIECSNEVALTLKTALVTVLSTDPVLVNIKLKITTPNNYLLKTFKIK